MDLRRKRSWRDCITFAKMWRFCGWVPNRRSATVANSTAALAQSTGMRTKEPPTIDKRAFSLHQSELWFWRNQLRRQIQESLNPITAKPSVCTYLINRLSAPV
jgi:hypothetical protein